MICFPLAGTPPPHAWHPWALLPLFPSTPASPPPQCLPPTSRLWKLPRCRLPPAPRARPPLPFARALQKERATQRRAPAAFGEGKARQGKLRLSALATGGEEIPGFAKGGKSAPILGQVGRLSFVISLPSPGREDAAGIPAGALREGRVHCAPLPGSSSQRNSSGICSARRGRLGARKGGRGRHGRLRVPLLARGSWPDLTWGSCGVPGPRRWVALWGEGRRGSRPATFRPGKLLPFKATAREVRQ